MYFTNNFGQFFTFCDKNFGTYRQPAKADDPLLVVLARQQKSNSAAEAASIQRQEQEMADALAKVEAGTSLLKKDL
jgi:lathosterol oxidase